MGCLGWVLVIASGLTLGTACNEPPPVTTAAIPASSGDPVADLVDAGVRTDTAPPDAGTTVDRGLLDSAFGEARSAPVFRPHEPFTSAQACARVASLPEVKAQGPTRIVPMTDEADGAGSDTCTGSVYECVHWCRVDRSQGRALHPWRYYGADATELYVCKSAARWPCYEGGVTALAGWNAGFVSKPSGVGSGRGGGGS